MNSDAPTKRTTDDRARPETGDGRSRVSARVAKVQGAYYVLSGAWPLVSPSSFQIVTGPKLDFWLAETVGLLLVVSGAVLFLAGHAGRITRELAFLGAGQAAVLGVIDLWCVLEPRTTRAYWLDAPIEFALLVAWCIARRGSAR